MLPPRAGGGTGVAAGGRGLAGLTSGRASRVGAREPEAEDAPLEAILPPFAGGRQREGR